MFTFCGYLFGMCPTTVLPANQVRKNKRSLRERTRMKEKLHLVPANARLRQRQEPHNLQLEQQLETPLKQTCRHPWNQFDPAARRGLMPRKVPAIFWPLGRSWMGCIEATFGKLENVHWKPITSPATSGPRTDWKSCVRNWSQQIPSSIPRRMHHPWL